MRIFTIVATAIITVSAVLLIQSFTQAESGEQKAANGKQPSAATCAPACWEAPKIPASINFAGEAVPLDRVDVKEALDREVLLNYYWQNNILYMMKLSARWFPAIEAELKRNGVPDDFKYLCIAESSLSNAISKAGATGFWQFLRGTAPGYALEISETVDERYNVYKSTTAACQYFKQAYNRFGNWTAAAASYNCGMGGYSERANFQGSNIYYDILLPEETSRYIYRILAYKHLLGNADSLGFNLPADEKYKPVPTRSVTITSNISNLATFAKQNGTSYKMLKYLNPWLRERSLKVRAGKGYEILLPA